MVKLDAVVFLVLFVCALAQNLAAVDSTPFHPDETRWLNRRVYVRDAFDPMGERWSEHYLTVGQPPGGSYLMGLGLLVQGRSLEPNGVWDFSRDEVWNIRRGNMPSQADLTAGRRTNALVGALTVGVVYLLGRRLTNAVGGVIGAAIFMLHPLAIRLGSQALSDAFLVLSVACAALCAIRLADNPRWSRAVVLGVALGVGALVKLSPLPISVLLAFYGIFLGVLPRVAPRLGQAWVGAAEGSGLVQKLLALPAFALATFVAGYPFLWPDPIVRTVQLFGSRVVSMGSQADSMPDLSLATVPDRLEALVARLGAEFSVAGRIANAAGALSWLPPHFDLILAGIGILAMGAVSIRRGLASPQALATVVLVGEALVVLAGIRLDFVRYFLPIVLVNAVAIGVLAGAAADLIGRAFRDRFGARSLSPRVGA